MRSIIDNLRILPIDSRIADFHARLFATLSQLGTPIGPHDSWIAAIALAYDFVLLTTNGVEFKRVDALHVIDFPG